MNSLSFSVPICEMDVNCQIPKCIKNRKDTLKLYELRWLSFRLLLESILLAEHFIVNHLLSARNPDRSKLHFRYLCYQQLIDLIRRTVHQALTNHTFTCSHVTLRNGRVRTYTTFDATFRLSVGSFLSRNKTTYFGVPVPTRVVQYLCRAIFGNRRFFNLHSIRDGYEEDIPLDEQTHQGHRYPQGPGYTT